MGVTGIGVRVLCGELCEGMRNIKYFMVGRGRMWRSEESPVCGVRYGAQCFIG